jgi:hypothetical protein
VPFPVLSRAEVAGHALAGTIEQELAMHKLTFHQPEVKDRIRALFGK